MSHAESSHEPHLPDPSIWPLAVGGAALIAGAALIWWSRDRTHDFAGVLLGVAVMAVLAAIGGWVWQDSRMRRKAEAEERGGRVEQVVEFALVAGGDETALMHAIEQQGDRLRPRDGFEDLRILRSTQDREVQVLVETTWASREALDSFEEMRGTFLDLLVEHAEVVKPGSTQVFTMQVEAESKDLLPRYSFAAAATLVGALLIGGASLGLGLSAIEGGGGDGVGPVGPDATPTPTGEFEGIVVAKAIKFVQTAFTLPPNTDVTLQMDNQDQGVPHNIAFYQSETPGEGGFLGGCISGCEDGDALRTPIELGLIVQTYTFTTPGVGVYGYLCEVHPTTMRGTMTIAEGAPVPVLPE